MARERGEEREDLGEAFSRGLAKGKDPTRQGEGTASVTTLRSPWLGRACARCAHTFRRGDRVLPSADGEASHAGAGAGGCPDEQSAIEEASPERAAFYAGVAAAYPPPPGLPLERIRPRPPSPGPPARPTCAVCGHSLRPFDEVVVCPCQPDAPLCKAAVHRDAIRALYCWDEWSKSALARYCPATSRKLG